MAEREIVSVEWCERDGLITVTYVDAEPDQMVAAQSVAAAFAQEAGLHPVTAPDGTWQRWVGNAIRNEEKSRSEVSR